MNTNKFLCFTILVFIIFSCGESEPILPKEEPDAISEIVTELNFPTGVSNQTVTFTTNKKWEASLSSTQGDVSWCTISPSSGDIGTINIIVSTSENTSYDDRSLKLTIKSGNTIKTTNITQKQKNAIIISNSTYEVSEEGGTFEIEANTNVDLEVSIPTGINWIKEKTSETRALSIKKIAFSVEKNLNPDSRNAIITIKDKNSVLSEKILVIE